MRAVWSTYVQIYIVGQYLLNIHGKIGGGTISTLIAAKYFLGNGCNACIVEFCFGYNFGHIVVSMLEPNTCINCLVVRQEPYLFMNESLFLVDFLIILSSESAKFSCSNAQVNFHQNILSRN